MNVLSPLNRAVKESALSAGREVHDATDRDAWLDLRKRDITASAAAGLLAASPYQTPYRLWCEKSGRADAPPETPAMRRGMLLEGVHAEMIAADRPGWRVERGAIYVRDPQARLGATPDLFCMRPDVPGLCVIQMKSVSPEAFRRSWRIDGSHEAEPPAHVQIQAMVEADMVGASRAMVSAMVIGDGIDLHLFEIDVRPRILAHLREETAAFWRRVAAGEPYSADYLADGDLILRAWRGDSPEIDLSDDERIVGIVAEHARLKAIERAGAEAEEARRAIEAEIVHRMGNAARAVISGVPVSVSRRTRKAYTAPAAEFTVVTIKHPKAAAPAKHKEAAE